MAKGRGERYEFWRQYIRAWRRSGQRRDEYCHEHGPNPLRNHSFSALLGAFDPCRSINLSLGIAAD